MAVSNLGTNAPNGTVGVSGFMRNAESIRFAPGIVSGFTPVFNGLSVQPAGGSPVNYAQSVNSNGDTEILGLNTTDTTSLQLSAPTTSGQSVVWSIVVYRDVTETTTANNGVGSVRMVALNGAAATTGLQTALTYPQIRSAITNGATAMLAVVMDITVTYGQNSLGAGNVYPWYSTESSTIVTNYFTPDNSTQWDRQIDAVLLGDMVVASVRLARNTNDLTANPWYGSTLWNAPAWLAPRLRPSTNLPGDMHFPTFNNADGASSVGLQVYGTSSDGMVTGTNISIRTNGNVKFYGNLTWITGFMSWPIATRS